MTVRDDTIYPRVTPEQGVRVFAPMMQCCDLLFFLLIVVGKGALLNSPYDCCYQYCCSFSSQVLAIVPCTGILKKNQSTPRPYSYLLL